MEYKEINIKLLKEEYWWGGASFDGPLMPFGESEYFKDLRYVSPNQGMPLFISNKGRYIWSNYPFKLRFKEGNLSIRYKYDTVEIGEGFENLRNVYNFVSKKYFPANGKLPHPVNFLSPQYNTWIEMHYNPTQEKVISYAKSILANGMPPGTFIIDDNWMKDYGSWDFNLKAFPEPKNMIEKLHSMGFKVMLWVCPYISPDGARYRKLKTMGILLRGVDGEPVIRNWWNGYSCILDLSNSKAEEWLQQQLDYLVSTYGIDGFKFDAGNPVISDDEGDEKFIWKESIFPNEDCSAYATIGEKYPFSEYRECWMAAGKGLMQRQQDKAHAWGSEGIEALIPTGLAQGLMGYTFNCPDMIGGGLDGSFEDPNFKMDQELFIRFAQCSVFFPIMQFSVAPWKVLDKEHLKYCSDIVELRKKFGPEILNLAEQSAKTGEPIIRPMDYVFSGKGYEKISDQFMLGDDILVAPVLKKGAVSRKIVFPDGVWKTEDGLIINGPIVEEIAAPIWKLPWFRKVI